MKECSIPYVCGYAMAGNRNIHWPPSGMCGITHRTGIRNENRSTSCFINCYYYLDTSAALSLFMLTRTSWDTDSISFSWTLHWSQINEQLPYLAQADIVTWGEAKSHDDVFCSQRLEKLCEPRPLDESSPTVSLQYPTFDITPAIMDIKEYYSELAESLKVNYTPVYTPVFCIS